MENPVQLFYCLNKDIKEVSQENGVTNISIVKIPTHISFRISYLLIDNGFHYPFIIKYVSFPSLDKELYDIIYSLLFPSVNINKAICHLQYNNEIIRNISYCIIKNRTSSFYFDDWLENSRTSYICLR